MIEHAPVTSTDKLEKPKKVNQEVTNNNHNEVKTASNVNNISTTLPRSSSIANRQFPAAYQTSSLRRNVSNSMTNLQANMINHHHVASNNQQESINGSANNHHGSMNNINGSMNRSLNNQHGSMNNIQSSMNTTQGSNSSDSTFQVPPSVVRGIVITVLQNQGIVDPSEEILQKAIQEYYTKNPQGVSSQNTLN